MTGSVCYFVLKITRKKCERIFLKAQGTEVYIFMDITVWIQECFYHCTPKTILEVLELGGGFVFP